MTHSHDHPPRHPDTTDVHGMLLFGDEARYLSHLPMFMHPHNFQVLFEVGFDEAAERALVRDRANGHQGFHTFVPEPFPILNLDPTSRAPVTSLRGTVVRGHFERGGTPIATQATATVRQVVYFSELDVNAGPADDQPLSYLAFGAGDERYLVHKIVAGPSFDHVLTARPVAGGAAPDGGLDSGVPDLREIRFDSGDTPGDRLVPGRIVEGLLEGAASSGPVKLEVQREVYLEIGELA